MCFLCFSMSVTRDILSFIRLLLCVAPRLKVLGLVRVTFALPGVSRTLPVLCAFTALLYMGLSCTVGYTGVGATRECDTGEDLTVNLVAGAGTEREGTCTGVLDFLLFDSSSVHTNLR